MSEPTPEQTQLINRLACELEDDSFLVLCGANRYIDGEQWHSNGTVTVTIKLRAPAPAVPVEENP